MSNLRSAYRGYEYQDLMVAARSVDLLLSELALAIVDEKLVGDDRFDDLTTEDMYGHRERVQFKYSDREGQVLSLKTFTSEDRKLRLDRLVACAVADRDGPGSSASSITFRVILRDNRPTSDSLLRYLKPASQDPGPFLPGMISYRLNFDVEELWPTHEPLAEDSEADDSPFAFLRTTPGMTRADCAWLCERLVVEVEAPKMSGDLKIPGDAEVLLLNRAIREIGAAQYPNDDRSPVDIGEALVTAARMARQGRIQLCTDELLHRAHIRSDFGTVSHRDPVNSAFEIARPMEVAELAAFATKMAQVAKPVIIEGPPGQGKSWTCKQLVTQLRSEGWLVADHFCYLGAADNERDARVYTESIFGTLLALINDADPAAVREQRPRFAASQLALEEAASKCLQRRPDRPVALIVDGLDHVSRVAPPSRASDPSRQLAEELAALVMPVGSVLIVLSQPGEHLVPLIEIDAKEVQTKGFTRDETAALVKRHGIIDGNSEDATSLDDIADAVYHRSQGNALYSTYLCRELLARGWPAGDALATVNSLPAYDGSLEDYYQHLYKALGAEAAWVADYLAFLDFAVTPHELAGIQPDRAHHVRDAVRVLGPVLDPQSPAGNIQVYHESFSRFLTDLLDEQVAKAINDRIAKWLAAKGLFADERAYRFLIPALARAGHHTEVAELVDIAFLMNSVAAGFPASAILANLSVAIGSAAQLNAWPVVVRCIELARGAATFEYERLDSVMVDFADVLVAVIGGEEYARKLLFRGQPVMPARTGLQICAALDEQDVPAPWEPYIEAFVKQSARDNTMYGANSDAQVCVAILRGRLRILGEEVASFSGLQGGTAANAANGWAGPPDALQSLVTYINENSGLPADKVAKAVLDTQGPAAALDVAKQLTESAVFALAAACYLNKNGRKDSPLFDEFLNLGLRPDRPPGYARILLDLGAPIDSIFTGSKRDRRALLLQLTEAVQHPTNYNEAIDAWMDQCLLAALDDPIGLAAAEASIKEGFWYRNWLRFSIHVALAEVADEPDRSEIALNAIRELNLATDPYAGEPRACDLVRVLKQVRETIWRAVHLLDDKSWREALAILTTMSSAISTTIDGELGGPFAADDLLNLAVESGATPTRCEATANLIIATLEQTSSRRYYTDLAMFRLIAARFALRIGDFDEATRQWVAACQMLSGYGYHKDITIYELLDPLPVLIKADPRRGREKVAAVQALADRIPAHTDGRETRHARSAWWRLLALADPTALAHLTAPAMVVQCNLPGALHESARESLWETWQLEVDPVIAGLLRLTLDLTLDSSDCDGLERLLETATRHRGLEAQIISLADERPASYSTSDGAALSDRDETRVHEINTLADRWNAPHVSLWSSLEASATATPATPRHDSGPANSRPMAATTPMDFPPGMAGIAHAIRAWRQRPYDAAAPTRDPAIFANFICHRLLDLIQEGRPGDADFALHLVAEADRFSSTQALLLDLAERIESASYSHFAAIAYAFHWTRTRGGNGWLTFGGETAIDSLRRALDLDRDATLTVVAEEVQRAVTGGNLGVTQAIIFAFALAEMPASEGQSTLDIAFQCWDEAAIVIGERAPRVHPWDDPDESYRPPIPDNEARYLGNLELAFALAIIAGVSNPGREQKRRAMLAVRMLLNYAPAVAGQALQQLLPALSDPATLVWILKLIESSGGREIVIAQCGLALTGLVVSDFLTVRSLARQLVPAESVPNFPTTQPDDVLLDRGDIADALWLPPGQREAMSDSDDDKIARTLQHMAGTRIKRGEAVLPRFLEAVQRRLQQSVTTEQFRTRMQRQLRAVGDANGVPDAYVALEEAIESAIQRVAAGGRLAVLANGGGIVDQDWEDRLAESIMDNPHKSLELEATRHPRPPIPIPPGPGSPDWAEIMEHVSGNIDTSRYDHAFLTNDRDIVVGTKISAADDSVRMVGGRFNGWRIIGSEEKRIITTSSNRISSIPILRCFGLEFREPGDRTGLTVPPLVYDDASVWVHVLPPTADAYSLVGSYPLLGYDRNMERYGDAAYGLGIPDQIMVPTRWLRSLWHLNPIAPYLLGDERGEALALVTWRTEYDRSDYHLPCPKMQGSAIVVRPDLLQQLEPKYGNQLSLRDFIAGPTRMIDSIAS